MATMLRHLAVLQRPAWGRIDRVIVQLTAAGAVVLDPDDLAGIRLQSDLDAGGLRTALATTGTGELLDSGTALLDLAVLRSLAALTPTTADWSQRWASMVQDARSAGRLSPDGRAIRVQICAT